VTAETTSPVSILAGLDLASWISAGSTTEHPLNPSSYADFAALEADEEAIRQLMTVHASVDYLAQATAGDSLMEDVINSNICAKWINLRDYALDTLSANSDIASEMATADKYGYGEWVITDSTTTPPTWGAKGNVPIMTANNAPYGTASMNGNVYTNYEPYKAFDNNQSTSWLATYGSTVNSRLQYEFTAPICPKKAKVVPYTNGTLGRLQGFKIQGYNGSSWVDLTSELSGAVTAEHEAIEVDITTNDYYTQLGLIVTQCWGDVGVESLQFYGRELKPLVPVMTGNDTPKGHASGSYYGSAGYDPFKAFDNDESTSWMGVYGSPTNSYLEYEFPDVCKPVMIKYVPYLAGSYNRLATFKIQGYIDNDYEDATGTLDGTVSSANMRKIFTLDTIKQYTKCKFIILSANSADAGVSELQYFGFDYSEKEFAPNSNRLTIYDHGVEVESITVSGTGTKGSNAITLSASGATATASITFTSGQYSALTGKTGLNASGSPRLICGSGYIAIADRASLDVSSMSGALSTGASQNGSGTVDIEELYLE
jgi:hypothetical protein